jgi:formate-dependent nitrite reductase cytochrome c552 subunit
MKISDHHVRSPLLNINRACQTCHHWPEEELRQRVQDIQDRTFGLRNPVTQSRRRQTCDAVTPATTVAGRAGSGCGVA